MRFWYITKIYGKSLGGGKLTVSSQPPFPIGSHRYPDDSWTFIWFRSVNVPLYQALFPFLRPSRHMSFAYRKANCALSLFFSLSLSLTLSVSISLTFHFSPSVLPNLMDVKSKWVEFLILVFPATLFLASVCLCHCLRLRISPCTLMSCLPVSFYAVLSVSLFPVLSACVPLLHIPVASILRDFGPYSSCDG